MDVKDQTKHTTPSGHDGHGVHLCHRCGWPFPNPHPSAKQRRSHKKHCGTIDGYTNLIPSDSISDDEHHDDDDKDKTPSPKIEKKTSVVGAIGGSFSRSEEDSFSDAVTDFSDPTSTGSATKTLDRDMFYSFKDADNGEISKVDANLPNKVETIEETEITESDSSEAKSDLVDADGAGANMEKVTTNESNEQIKNEKLDSEWEHVSEVSKDAEIVEGVKGVSEEIKPEKTELGHEVASEVVKESETGQSISDLTEKENLDLPKLEKDSIEQIQEVVKEPLEVLTKKDDLCVPESEKEHTHEVIEEPKLVLTEKEDLGESKLEKDSVEKIQEVVKEPVEVLTEKENLDAPKLENCPVEEIEEVEKKPESVLTEKDDLGESKLEKESNEQTHEVLEEPKLEKDLKIEEVVKEPVVVLTEKDDLCAPELEKSSKELILEDVQEPKSVLIEKEDLGAPKSENGSKEEIPEVSKEPESILTEKEDLGAPESESGLIGQIQKAVMETVTVLTDKIGLTTPESENCSNEPTDEVFEEPKTDLTEKDDLGAQILEKSSEEVVKEPESTLIEKEDICEPKLENEPKEQIQEVVEESKAVLTEKENLGAPILEETPKEHVQEEIIKEAKVDDCIVDEKNASNVVSSKPIVNQDSGVDLSVDSSSHNSLEGTWGSVSVLSTASIDDKPKKQDVYEPPSFMTLVQPEGKVQKPGSSEVKDAEKAGWIPTITNVSNESEGRKKNEEAIAKVTNWSSGKNSAPLKNLLGEAKSPSVKESVNVDHKDEGANEKVKEELLSSPPKLIEDGKKGAKKVKRSWMPFVCCSSVNVN